MNKNLISIIALMVVPLSGLSVDIYVPSLPHMASYFNISESWVQNTITIYLISYAISQLFAGIACDIWGRKLLTIVPLILYVGATVGILFATDIKLVLLYRFIQGIMVGFFAVAQRAIIVDIYNDDKKKLHAMANYITIAWSIGPIIAPVIGGYIQHLLGWRINFLFLAIYGLVVAILVAIYVPETLEKRVKVSMAYILTSYTTILGNRGYNYGFICNGLLYLINISFSSIGAFIVQVKMGYSPIIFGYCALFLGLAWFTGQVLNKILIRYSIMGKLLIASKISVVIALAGFIWSLFDLSLYHIIISIMLLNISSATIFANYFIRNSTMFPQYAGNAGALQAAGLLMVTSIVGAVANGIIPTTSLSYLMGLYLIIAVVSMLLTYKIKKIEANKT